MLKVQSASWSYHSSRSTLHLHCYNPCVYTLQAVAMHHELCHLALLALCAFNQPIRWCLTKPLLSLCVPLPKDPFLCCNVNAHACSLVVMYGPSMSIPRASHWCFFWGVSANQKASIESARLGTHLNTDWLIQPQCPWWPSSTNAKTAASGTAAAETFHGAWAMASKCTADLALWISHVQTATHVATYGSLCMTIHGNRLVIPTCCRTAVYHDRIQVFPLLWSTWHCTAKLAQVLGTWREQTATEKRTIRPVFGHSEEKS